MVRHQNSLSSASICSGARRKLRLFASDSPNEAIRRASNRFLLAPSFIRFGCRHALRTILSFLRLSRGLGCKPIT
jgi:hypothetical protein